MKGSESLLCNKAIHLPSKLQPVSRFWALYWFPGTHLDLAGNAWKPSVPGSGQDLLQGQVRRCCCPAAWMTHSQPMYGQGLGRGSCTHRPTVLRKTFWEQTTYSQAVWGRLESSKPRQPGDRDEWQDGTQASVPAGEAHRVPVLGSPGLWPARSQAATPALALPHPCPQHVELSIHGCVYLGQVTVFG